MADLKVSYDKLEESSKNLEAIQNELEHVADRQKEIKGILGSGDIAHAMDDFASNWDYHKRKLQDKAKTLGQRIEKTMEAFHDADHKLGTAAEGGKK